MVTSASPLQSEVRETRGAIDELTLGDRLLAESWRAQLAAARTALVRLADGHGDARTLRSVRALPATAAREQALAAQFESRLVTLTDEQRREVSAQLEGGFAALRASSAEAAAYLASAAQDLLAELRAELSLLAAAARTGRRPATGSGSPTISWRRCEPTGTGSSSSCSSSGRSRTPRSAHRRAGCSRPARPNTAPTRCCPLIGRGRRAPLRRGVGGSNAVDRPLPGPARRSDRRGDRDTAVADRQRGAMPRAGRSSGLRARPGPVRAAHASRSCPSGSTGCCSMTAERQRALQRFESVLFRKPERSARVCRRSRTISRT